MFRNVLMVACLLGFAFPSWAADKFVKIVHVETGKVLALAEDSTENVAKVVLAKDDKNEARQWKVVTDGNAVKIVNRKSEKVLDVEGASTDEGAALIQYDDKTEDNDNQRFIWVGDGETKRLKAKGSGHVLDVDADGNVVQKASSDTAKGQLWKVVPVTD